MNNRINFDEEGKEQVNIRFNVINIIVYLIGIILIAQLFNLQVVHGESYREQSNTRLSRTSTIKAARGSILDRSGNELAGVKTENNIEIYKTNISNDELNAIRTQVDKYTIEGDLRREVNMNIKTKMEINSYQGTRHKKGLPVRGQRTNRNARTRKGKGKTVANKKK